MRICPACYRHIREEQCPFCHADASAAPTLAGGKAMRVGVARGAILGVVLAASACGASDSKPEVDSVNVETANDPSFTRPLPAYGLPPNDAGLPDAVAPPRDAGPDHHPVIMYGLPPILDGEGNP